MGKPMVFHGFPLVSMGFPVFFPFGREPSGPGRRKQRAPSAPTADGLAVLPGVPGEEKPKARGGGI